MPVQYKAKVKSLVSVEGSAGHYGKGGIYR